MIFKPQYIATANQAITITLNSLANGTPAWSNEIDNSTNLYSDILIGGIFAAGPSGVSSTGTLSILVAGTTGGTGTEPITNVSDADLVQVLICNANSATPKLTPKSIAAIYGGRLPRQFKIGVLNNSGAALASSGNSMNFDALNDQGV